jgi:integrase
MQQIQRRIARGGLSPADEADLWDCVFLTLAEIAELLEHVRHSARYPFVFAMFVFAAHTGVRRSEMLRCKWSDLDLDGTTATIHERKRDHTKSTTRRVPISPYLGQVLRAWQRQHPGGDLTFCKPASLTNGYVARGPIGAISHDEAHDHFKRTLAGSKWAKLRGWHVFRHSFCSNCAGSGIDQRIINAWVGHQTEDMVRRYRHLIPNQEQLAIQTVFGNGEQPVVLNAK